MLVSLTVSSHYELIAPYTPIITNHINLYGLLDCRVTFEKVSTLHFLITYFKDVAGKLTPLTLLSKSECP